MSAKKAQSAPKGAGGGGSAPPTFAANPAPGTVITGLGGTGSAGDSKKSSRSSHSAAAAAAAAGDAASSDATATTASDAGTEGPDGDGHGEDKSADQELASLRAALAASTRAQEQSAAALHTESEKAKLKAQIDAANAATRENHAKMTKLMKGESDSDAKAAQARAAADADAAAKAAAAAAGGGAGGDASSSSKPADGNAKRKIPRVKPPADLAFAALGGKTVRDARALYTIICPRPKLTAPGSAAGSQTDKDVRDFVYVPDDEEEAAAKKRNDEVLKQHYALLAAYPHLLEKTAAAEDDAKVVFPQTAADVCAKLVSWAPLRDTYWRDEKARRQFVSDFDTIKSIEYGPAFLKKFSQMWESLTRNGIGPENRDIPEGRREYIARRSRLKMTQQYGLAVSPNEQIELALMKKEVERLGSTTLANEGKGTSSSAAAAHGHNSYSQPRGGGKHRPSKRSGEFRGGKVDPVVIERAAERAAAKAVAQLMASGGGRPPPQQRQYQYPQYDDDQQFPAAVRGGRGALRGRVRGRGGAAAAANPFGP